MICHSFQNNVILYPAPVNKVMTQVQVPEFCMLPDPCIEIFLLIYKLFGKKKININFKKS